MQASLTEGQAGNRALAADDNNRVAGQHRGNLNGAVVNAHAIAQLAIAGVQHMHISLGIACDHVVACNQRGGELAVFECFILPGRLAVRAQPASQHIVVIGTHHDLLVARNTR